MKVLVTVKGSSTSGWYAPPRGTHTGEKHRAVGSGKTGKKVKAKVTITPKKQSKIGSSPVKDKKGVANRGVNPSVLVEFEDGSKGIWKPLEAKPGGVVPQGDLVGSSKSEVLAYQLDQSLGWDLVPETSYMELDGQNGSVQRWVENSKTGMSWSATSDVLTQDLENFMTRMDKNLGQQYARMKVLDVVIDNGDRHMGNWLISAPGGKPKLHAIDNGTAFQVWFRGKPNYSARNVKLPRSKQEWNALSDNTKSAWQEFANWASDEREVLWFADQVEKAYGTRTANAFVEVAGQTAELALSRAWE